MTEIYRTLIHSPLVQVIGLWYVLRLLTYLSIMECSSCLQVSWEKGYDLYKMGLEMYSLEVGMVVSELLEGCLFFLIPVFVLYGVLLACIGAMLMRPTGRL